MLMVTKNLSAFNTDRQTGLLTAVRIRLDISDPHYIFLRPRNLEMPSKQRFFSIVCPLFTLIFPSTIYREGSLDRLSSSCRSSSGIDQQQQQGGGGGGGGGWNSSHMHTHGGHTGHGHHHHHSSHVPPAPLTAPPPLPPRIHSPPNAAGGGSANNASQQQQGHNLNHRCAEPN